MQWTTPLTASLGIELPFVSAGMGFVALPPLAAAVSEAGGLGLLGAAPAPAPALREMIAEARRRTTKPFGVDLIVDETAFGPSTTDEHIEACAEASVPVVVFFWQFPEERWLDTLRAAGCRVWIQVGELAAAQQAADRGFNAVIVQGAEAGGHNRGRTGLFTLLPAVVDALAPLPVLAAGGIADGRGVAAAFTLGAAGVVVGTRLVASEEAHAHAEWQRRIVASAAGDVARTSIFGPEWPDQPMRVLRNRVVGEWEGRDERTPDGAAEPAIGRTRVLGQEYEMPKFSAILPTPEAEGDFEEMCLASGESAALVRSVEPAGRIVRTMMEEAADRLRLVAGTSRPPGR